MGPGELTQGGEAAATQRRILIVDDDQDLAFSLGDILSMRGYLVETANDAAQAAAVSERFDMHVALVDVNLGRDLGLEVIAQLKQRHPRVLYVAMTANVEQHTVCEARENGAHECLEKPLRPNEVLATLDRYFADGLTP